MYALVTNVGGYGKVVNEYSLESISSNDDISGRTVVTLSERGDIIVPTEIIDTMYDADEPYAVVAEIAPTDPDFWNWGVSAGYKKVVLHLPPGEF